MGNKFGKNGDAEFENKVSAIKKLLPSYVDFVASNFISGKFRKYTKLDEDKYCQKLVIVTADMFSKRFTPQQIEYMYRRIKDGVNENEESLITRNIFTIEDKYVDDLRNEVRDTEKQRMCIGIAKFYVRIGHLFSAIAKTVDSQYNTDATQDFMENKPDDVPRDISDDYNITDNVGNEIVRRMERPIDQPDEHPIDNMDNPIGPIDNMDNPIGPIDKPPIDNMDNHMGPIDKPPIDHMNNPIGPIDKPPIDHMDNPIGPIDKPPIDHMHRDRDRRVVDEGRGGAFDSKSRLGLCARRIRALIGDLDLTKVDAGEVGDNSVDADGNVNLKPKVCSVTRNAKTLDEETGIFELKNLYYDVYNYTTGKYDKISAQSMKQYERDLELFYKAFTGEDKPDEVRSFDQIKIKDFRDTAVCREDNGDDEEEGIFRKSYSVNVREALFKELAKHMAHMYRRSNESYKSLMDILDILFSIRRDDNGEASITINPELTKKALDKLTVKTREVIIKLYVNCEEDYVKGLEILTALIDKQMKDNGEMRATNIMGAIDTLAEKPDEEDREPIDEADENLEKPDGDGDRDGDREPIEDDDWNLEKLDREPIDDPFKSPIDVPESKQDEKPDGEPIEKPDGEPIEKPDGEPIEKPDDDLGVPEKDMSDKNPFGDLGDLKDLKDEKMNEVPIEDLGNPKPESLGEVPQIPPEVPENKPENKPYLPEK